MIIAPYAAAASRNAGSHSPEFASRPDSLARSSFEVSGPEARSKHLKMGPRKPIFSAESSFHAGLLVANRARAIRTLLIMSLLVRAAAATQTASLNVGAIFRLSGIQILLICIRRRLNISFPIVSSSEYGHSFPKGHQTNTELSQ